MGEIRARAVGLNNTVRANVKKNPPKKVVVNFDPSVIEKITDEKEVEYYKEDYEVTPSTEEQILKTKNKKMRDNVTVHEIPTYEVSNESDGSTFIIGEFTI